jgi:hypothetical protein
MRGISWLAQKFTAFQEGSRSTELVTASCYTYTVEWQHQYVLNAKKKKIKKAVVAYFEVLSHHFPGGTEENLDKCESSRASSGLILSPKSRKHYPLYRKIRNVLINFNLNLSEFSQWRKYRPCVYVKWKKSNLLRRLLTPILISGTLRAFYISQMEWL